MPFGLEVLMALHGLTAFASALFIVAASVGLGSYRINSQPVPGLVFLKSFGLLMVLVGAVAAVVAYAFRVEKLWTRDLVFTAWAGVSGGIVVWNLLRGQSGTALKAACNFGVYIGVLAWYLFRRRVVREYYQALEDQ
jgi:hypothetical protein